ncbi:MAG: hypothetical protein ABIN36_02840 [Ferruginibacter sp.]
MISLQHLTQKNKIIAFVAIFLITSLLAALLISFVWNDNPVKPVTRQAVPDIKTNVRAKNLVVTLCSRVTTLKELDKKFDAAITAKDTSNIEVISRQLADQERSMRITLDSFNMFRTPYPDSNFNQLVNSVVGAFGAMLQSREIRNK